ncbi:hypothetical protein C0995_016533 [Termitomyces sp. Mi166|nr:hypothetical protein C0995_016533 [Termitomyces sp. Mi166\
MGSLEEFESVLKDVVLAKRLSASKMSNLTDIALKSMENDTQLVSTLYRTHKSLPPTAKVSSLYVFDALSRAARHHANKHGISADTNSVKGNCATFLSKVEGVLEGLFQDMMTVGSSEAKEKTKKILDIWVKGSTFPPKILTRLSSLVEGTEKVPDVPTSSSVVDPRIAAAQPAMTTPVVAPTTTPPAPAMDPQATLLALLAQAAQATTVPVQTNINTGVDTAQLAVLQQLALAQTANNGAPSQPTPPQAHPAMSHSAFPTPSYREEPSYNSHKDPRLNGPQSSERVNAYDDQAEDRSSYRGGYRGGFRGRGRGRWDDRDRDRYRDDRNSPRRIRRSRSRSPPRYGARRDVRPYSPSRRPNLASTEPHGRGGADSRPPPENDGKDEFGRDIRSQSPDSDKTPPKSDAPRSPRLSSPVPASTPAPASITQITPEPTVDPTPAPTSNHDRMSLSPLIAANTSSSIRNASIVSSTASTQPGLEDFNPMTFDFTSPASWEALGKMWQVTKGYLPSTEELSQFVLTSGQATFAPMIQAQKWQSTPDSQAWRGGGRGGGFSKGRGGFFHNNARNPQEEWEQYEANNETDAIVLGEGSTSAAEETKIQGDSSTTDQATHTGGTGGKMQRVGDKWVFVREPMATKAAHDKGKRVKTNLPNLLDSKDLGGHGTLKHQAAVIPAIQRDRTVIPENAVEE